MSLQFTFVWAPAGSLQPDADHPVLAAARKRGWRYQGSTHVPGGQLVLVSRPEPVPGREHAGEDDSSQASAAIVVGQVGAVTRSLHQQIDEEEKRLAEREVKRRAARAKGDAVPEATQPLPFSQQLAQYRERTGTELVERRKVPLEEREERTARVMASEAMGKGQEQQDAA